MIFFYSLMINLWKESMLCIFSQEVYGTMKAI